MVREPASQFVKEAVAIGDRFEKRIEVVARNPRGLFQPLNPGLEKSSIIGGEGLVRPEGRVDASR